MLATARHSSSAVRCAGPRSTRPATASRACRTIAVSMRSRPTVRRSASRSPARIRRRTPVRATQSGFVPVRRSSSSTFSVAPASPCTAATSQASPDSHWSTWRCTSTVSSTGRLRARWRTSVRASSASAGSLVSALVSGPNWTPSTRSTAAVTSASEAGGATAGRARRNRAIPYSTMSSRWVCPVRW